MSREISLPGRCFPYVMAHRGNRAVCPENTLASFRQALQDGADILETDLHLSADGVFMCIHDGTLDRTTEGTGPVADKTLAELKAVSAGKGFPQFRSETIPTLAELCAIIPQDVALALELKSDRFLEPEIGRKLGAELAVSEILDRTIILSFSKARLLAVQAQVPGLPAGVISITSAWPASGVQFSGPIWPLTFVNPFYVMIAHARKQMTCPLDPAPEKRLWWYTFLRYDSILTDNPAKTIPLIKKYRTK